MKTFDGLAAFAAFTTEMIVTVKEHEHEMLDHAGKTIEDEAKRVIGTYEYGWEPLAESTLKRKAADTPLLETGEMRDSISHTVVPREHEVHIGSNEDKALWQELGTRKIPPRSFLAGAAIHKKDEVGKAIGAKVFKVLKGERS